MDSPGGLVVVFLLMSNVAFSLRGKSSIVKQRIECEVIFISIVVSSEIG